MTDVNEKNQTQSEIDQKAAPGTPEEAFKAATHSTDDAPATPPGPAQSKREVIGREEETEK